MRIALLTVENYFTNNIIKTLIKFIPRSAMHRINLLQFHLHSLTHTNYPTLPRTLTHNNSPLNSPVFTEYERFRKPISNGFDMRFFLRFPPSTWSDTEFSVSSTEFSDGVTDRLLVNLRLFGRLARRRMKETRFVVEDTGSTITSLSSSIRRKSSATATLLNGTSVFDLNSSSSSSSFSMCTLLVLALLARDSSSRRWSNAAASACSVSVTPIIVRNVMICRLYTFVSFLMAAVLYYRTTTTQQQLIGVTKHYKKKNPS